MKRFGIVGLGRLTLLFVGALALSTVVHRPRMTPQQRAHLLKAPSTAHFGGEAFVRVPGTNVRSGSFWADSQNSFGAMVRTHFRCSVIDYVGRFHDFKGEQLK
jgi:hypothetical protein